MKFILVVDRRTLFPGLSPQGALPLDAVDLSILDARAFFAERDYMEQCSHYQQIIPYIALQRDGRVLCYQRQQKHSEQRLGGLWTVGFGGHIEPIDRTTPEVREVGMLEAAALRELREETGLEVAPDQLVPRGFINSDANDVSSVHFGVLYAVDLADDTRSEDEIAALVRAQAEPHRVEWCALADLVRDDGSLHPAPHSGEWEDWTELALPRLVLD